MSDESVSEARPVAAVVILAAGEGKRMHSARSKLLHEIAAGSMDVAHHEVEYQAQGYWHGFQFRYGEMTGIDRKKQLVYLAATYDEAFWRKRPDWTYEPG